MKDLSDKEGWEGCGRILIVILDCDCRILGENKNYGTLINPQKPSYVPGGSSSGSAVAVAGQIVDFALGLIFFASTLRDFHSSHMFSRVYKF